MLNWAARNLEHSGMIWHGSFGLVWSGMVWYGLVWCGMVCNGTVWHCGHGMKILPDQTRLTTKPNRSSWPLRPLRPLSRLVSSCLVSGLPLGSESPRPVSQRNQTIHLGPKQPLPRLVSSRLVSSRLVTLCGVSVSKTVKVRGQHAKRGCPQHGTQRYGMV